MGATKHSVQPDGEKKRPSLARVRRRGSAPQLRQRLEILAEASASLLGSLDTAEVLPGVLELARRLIYADAYAVWRGDPSGGWRVASAVGLSETFTGEVIRASDAYRLPEEPFAAEDVERFPLLSVRQQAHRSEGIRSLLCVPLLIHGHLSGSIVFYYRQRRRFDEEDVQAAAALANLAGAAIGTAELYQEQRALRAQAEESQRRAVFLAEAGTILSSSLDYETTLASVARLAVPHVADWCTVDMVEEDGSLRQLALAHVDPSKIAWARDFNRLYPPDPQSADGIPNVIRTGEPEIVSEISDAMYERTARDATHLRMLREAHLKSYMCVPLRARGLTLGAITFLTAESGRIYGARDLALATSLAGRAALAVENARLFATAQRDREVAQAALAAQQESEARFRRLVDSGIIGIVLGNSETLTEVNDRFLQMIGYRHEDLPAGGLSWRALTAPEFHAAHDRAVAELASRGACTPFEKEFLRRDGSRVPALFGAALLKESPELSFVGFVIDLTERRQLEERLRESQKLESIGLLAGGIAHDFNNLLTGIMGNASLALEDVQPSHRARPMLEGVILASQRAADLTRQLLAYSGKGRFVVQPVEVSGLIREMAGLAQTLIPKKVRLLLDLADELPPIHADSSQVQQLVMNLIINAAEAIGEQPGTVLVTTGQQEVDAFYIRSPRSHHELTPGFYVCVQVHDTGCGMDVATQARIFEPFFTTKFTGRGLGLAAALGIVRGHHGDIQVDSAPGRGSTFRVLLPVSREHWLKEAPPEENVADLRGSGLVLVVDDEEVVRETARAALEHYGYSVVLAADGREAVGIFKRMAPEIALVLLDTAMPVMGGDEALAQLKNIRPDVRVIVSSGYNENETVRRFAGLGVTSFIQKPYSAAQLVSRVKKELVASRSASVV